uniref:Uncharacterized protein n=1 Tax=Hanusia phi TaxID=3032 RepID=A0A7S0F5Z9_9CRYP|mmetsp:Transcript_40/g.106  ORF Transcript_40/g.106 Transcript_40/m.106 type:complete len:238 (+) Transcript_40:285-998(+)|eukprot:745812-Hanusia_phi.AAC.4
MNRKRNRSEFQGETLLQSLKKHKIQRVSFAGVATSRSYTIEEVSDEDNRISIGMICENSDLQDKEKYRLVDSVMFTKKQDGPADAQVIVLKLLEGLVKRKITDSSDVLKCFITCLLGKNSPVESTKEKGQNGVNEMSEDILWCVGKGLASTGLFDQVAERLKSIATRLKANRIVGILPGSTRLDATFLEPLKFLYIHVKKCGYYLEKSRTSVDDTPAMPTFCGRPNVMERTTIVIAH